MSSELKITNGMYFTEPQPEIRWPKPLVTTFILDDKSYVSSDILGMTNQEFDIFYTRFREINTELSAIPFLEQLRLERRIIALEKALEKSLV